jgi:hypothetical protein
MADSTKQVLKEVELNDVLATVREAYSPQIAEALRAELALVASLSYADMPCCLALILEGPSGVGKSALVEMLNPNEANEPYMRREDRFTAASFVSNASNVRKEKLKDIDLLPKIAGKVMLTKELASMFGSDDKALREMFGIVTAVLDGKGYKTATGTHGERGYVGDLRFNWIGATTPIPIRIHNVMALFGCRFLFYECRFPEPDYEEILGKMKDVSSYAMQEECNALVNAFVFQHFERYAVKSIHTENIEMPDEIFRGLYDYVRLMTLGRRAVFPENNGTSSDEQTEVRFYASPPEAPFRPIEMFRSIAIGSALIARRQRLTADDLAIVRHIAFSSIPDKRRRLLRCLIRAEGNLTSANVVEKLGCSKPTALRWMRELAATELCEFHDNETGSSRPDSMTLNERFDFLIRTVPNSEEG